MRKLFNFKLIATSLLVLAASGVMARLGVWQLDRLAQRRAINLQKTSQFEAPTLSLDASSLNLDLPSLEFRPVTVKGEYQHDLQVLLKNQVWNNRLGVHLLTPLKIFGTNNYVLVDRGWIPQEDAFSGDLAEYDNLGIVEVSGVIRSSQPIPPLNLLPDPTLTPDQTKLDSWVTVNLERIELQIPDLIDIYVQETFKDNQDFPYVKDIDREVSEGSHQGYAIQWFLFAAMFLVGYVVFLNKKFTGSDKIPQS